MSAQLNLTKIQLGSNADQSKNFVISVPDTPDGTLTIERGNGTDVLTVDASGVITATNGLVTNRMILGTSVATTSGTSIDFTGIPSWAKRITAVLSEVSTNGTSPVILRIGSGTVDTSGYTSYAGSCGSTFSTGNTSSIGFQLDVGTPQATSLRAGSVVLTEVTSNVWVASFGTGHAISGNYYFMGGGGSKTLAGVLDRIRLTTVNGTDTFDAGTVNILYEG